MGANEFDKFIDDSIKLFKVADGDNMIRILPPTWPKPKHYGLDIHVHYGVGPDRQTYLCLHKMKGEACPICEERSAALADGEEKYAKEIEPKRRVLVYLIDRNNEKEGLMAWAMPWTVDRDICTISRDKKTGEALPIDHPEEGFDVMFEKKGQKDRTEYIGMQIERRDSPLGKLSWLEEAQDLPLTEALKFFSYDHIAKAFGGGGAHKEKARDDDEEDQPRRRGRDSGDRERDGARDDDRGDRGASGSGDRTRGRSGADDRDDDRGDRDRGGSRRRVVDEPTDDPAYTWEQIHEMTGDELDALVEGTAELEDINPKKFKSDEDLADAICEALDITKKAARRVVKDDDEGDAPRSRLASMREKRERGDR